MTTITNSETFTILDATIEVATTQILVLPVGAAGTGKGRLVHPVLGTYDYPYRPDEYTNLLGDVVVDPTWAHTTTETSGVDTLWQGNIRDVVCKERWTGRGGLSIPATMLDMLMAFYTTPPDPEDAVEADRYIEWWPSYTTALGFKVALEAAGSGGRDGLTLTQIIKQGWLEGPFQLDIRIIDRA